MANDNASFFTRAWQALRKFDEAMSLSSEDIVLARLGSLEQEIRSLKADIDRKAAK